MVTVLWFYWYSEEVYIKTVYRDKGRENIAPLLRSKFRFAGGTRT